MSGVVEIDVTVVATVQDQEPSRGSPGVGHYFGAVIAGLVLAGAVESEGQTAEEEQRNNGAGHGPGAAPDPYGHPEQHEHKSHHDHDRPRGKGGDQHEPGHESAEDGSRGPNGGVRPDHRTRLLQRGQSDLHHDGWNRRQDRCRGEEPDEAEADDRNRPGRGGRAGQVDQQWRCHRCQAAGDEERPDEATGVSTIRRPPAGPRPDGDPRKDHTDDAGEHLEAHPQVGREQPPGQDLQDQNRGRGDEDEGPSEELWQPPEYARRHEYAAYDAANAEVVSGRGVVAARSVHHRRGEPGPQNRRQRPLPARPPRRSARAPVNSWRI